MTEVATITSKRQLTIPSRIFKKIKLSKNQKVLVSEESGKIIITPAMDLIERLAGSLKMPRRWENKNLDQIVEGSKREYFSAKK